MATFCSIGSEEQNVLDLIEASGYQQAIKFENRSQNILDVAFFKNCHVFAANDSDFSKDFDCSDHETKNILLQNLYYLPPWISSGTSNLMKKLRTRKQLLEQRPISYRRNQITKLQNKIPKQELSIKKISWHHRIQTQFLNN